MDSIFQPLLPGFQERGGVPARLPAKLPELGQGKDPLYAVLGHADRNAYTIYLSFTPDCNGASVCRLGTLSGQALSALGSKKNAKARANAVRLANGTIGVYAQSECGANCSDSVVRWREGAAEYSAGVKGGSREDVLQLANSCLKR